MSDYEHLPREQLVELLKKRDRTKKLGLVWERDEIEADNAVDADFVAATLVPDLCEKPAAWHNLIIEGDNFDALRWLRMAYPEGIKCIYIDPPYNTGNTTWVYNDKYIDAEDRYRQSTWLEFLFRRLTLARDLLSEDGVILISINEENRARLELMADEALPGMKAGSLVWRTRVGSNADHEVFMSGDHEHVLIYAKDGFRFTGTEKTFAMYKNYDPSKDDWYRLDNLTLGFNYLERPNLAYPLQDPETGICYPYNPDRVWVYPTRSRSKVTRTKFMEDWISAGHINFPSEQRIETWDTLEELHAAIDSGEVPKSGRALLLRKDLPDLEFWVGKEVGFGTPSFKRYKKDLRNQTQPLSSWISPRNEVDIIPSEANVIVSGTNDEGAKVIKAVFGEKAFNYAKPLSLVRELLRQATSPNDVVLDFFAGSATTAHAVMELNAEDNGNRRFIMVSSTEATEKEPEKNLCRDVAAKRIRLINSSDDKDYAGLAADFAYLQCEKIEFENLDLDLRPDQIWTSLEAMHSLPLTLFDHNAGWQEHQNESVTVIFADQVRDELISRLVKLVEMKLSVIVYCWAPGQITQQLGQRVDVRNVRDVLVNRFSQ
jgi:adenine-specific DNA-methyltransferase